MIPLPAGEPLPLGEVHLWHLFTQGASRQLLTACRGLLDRHEQERLERYRLERPRLQYLLTRALTRSVLSRYFPVHPRLWRFEAGERGKPEIILPKGSGLCFNISHTDRLIACAVARQELGVDAEHLRGGGSPLELARRFFSAAEILVLEGLEGEARRCRFFEFWTLKEAYLKAKGVGLAHPLDQLCFAGGALSPRFGASLDDDPSRWRFRLFRPGPEHLVALCMAGEFRLKVYQALHPEQQFTAPPLGRGSGI